MHLHPKKKKKKSHKKRKRGKEIRDGHKHQRVDEGGQRSRPNHIRIATWGPRTNCFTTNKQLTWKVVSLSSSYAPLQVCNQLPLCAIHVFLLYQNTSLTEYNVSRSLTTLTRPWPSHKNIAAHLDAKTGRDHWIRHHHPYEWGLSN
jgi:hypothetical protein